MGSANRAWRSCKLRSNNTVARRPGVYTWLTKTATVTEFRSSELTFTFLTGHPTDVLPSRNIIPYYEMPIYKTTGWTDILARKLQIDATGRFEILWETGASAS